MTAWSAEEERQLARAREVEEGAEHGALGQQILTLAEAVFERAHRKHDLRKSGELTRLLRLFESHGLFPGDHLLEARLALLWRILAHSPQRPVLSCAGLVALDLELDHGWSADPRHRDQALRIARETPTPVMPVVALESQLLGRPTAAERLDGQAFNDRRLRLVELIEVLDTYPDSAGLEPLVSGTFEEVFEQTTPREKRLLAERLIRELRDRHSTQKHDRWTLMVDPLMLQNRGQPALQAKVIELVSGLPGRLLTPYLRFYLQTVPPEALSLPLVRRAADCGTSVLPFLRPLTERRLLWTRTPLARAAQEAIDAIIEREGLGGLVGGLTILEDGTEGALSVVDATQGPLSVGPTTALIGSSSARGSHLGARGWLARLIGRVWRWLRGGG